MEGSRARRVMALDVGSRRIGTAVSDPSGAYALPSVTIDRQRGSPEREIIAIIREKEIEQLVVGLPLGRNGERNERCLLIENFCRRLQKRVDIPIHYVDEHLSSVSAEEQLAPIQGFRANKGDIDSVAASIILNSFLKSGPGE